MRRSHLLQFLLVSASACVDATPPLPIPGLRAEPAARSALDAQFVGRVPKGGSVVVDGRMSPVEWGDALAFPLDVHLPGGGTVPGRLFLKHDGTNLYFAVRYARSEPNESGAVVFEFDANADGVSENGDDVFVYNSAAAQFFDDVRTNQSPPCPPDSPPAFCAPQDIDVGGTTDGAGAFAVVDGVSGWELAHPLNSGDIGHDFELGPGSTIGMWMALVLIAGEESANTLFPGRGSFSLFICCPPRQ
jgi:hypothetical protein